MERIRAKQEKYHQERLPGGEGQDGARAGESRLGGPQPLQPLFCHRNIDLNP